VVRCRWAADFEYLGEAVKLKTVCVYGGAPMGAQEGALRRGVDVVVGTPGRVKVRTTQDPLWCLTQRSDVGCLSVAPPEQLKASEVPCP